MKNFTQKFIGLLALVLATSFVNAQTFTLTCFDSYGDGWHGGFITINGVNYCGDFFSGSEQTHTIAAENICSIMITTENYGEEVTWTLGDLWSGGPYSSYINLMEYYVPDGSCIIEGCTDETALNYNYVASEDDGSCIAVVEGCLDQGADNYDVDANAWCWDCCEYPVMGCTDNGLEINGYGQVNDANGDGMAAINYNPDATVGDGSCIPVILGCMDETAYNYNSDANTDDGSCVSIIFGCTDSTAFNFDSQANTDDGACLPKIFGCTDQSASNFNSIANTDDGLCIPYVQLPEGWSIFGYTCLESLDVVDAFSEISASIEIVKDEWGLAYLPAWGFSAFDNLEFGEGYQIKMIENVTDFEFCGTNWLEDGVSQADLDLAVEQVEISYADHTPPLDLQIGDYYAGGIVFQINENGSGLVAAMEDLDGGNDPGDVGGGYEWTVAVTQASNYSVEGYTGWHLPSRDEIELMYNTIGGGGPEGNIGGFENWKYWSSTYADYWLNPSLRRAWCVDFSDGGVSPSDHYLNRVRVIRNF